MPNPMKRLDSCRARALLFLALCLPLAAIADNPAPDVLVRATTDDVMRLLQDDKDLKAGNPARVVGLIEEKIVPHFDFARMTKLAVGRSWREATPEQQKALVHEFQTLLVRSYATAYTAYRQIKVDVKPLKLAGGEDDVTVKSQILLPGGAPPVGVDYSMGASPEGWKVYNIAVDGVSLVTTYRNDFGAQIQQGGLDALIRSLQARNSKPVGQARK